MGNGGERQPAFARPRALEISCKVASSLARTRPSEATAILAAPRTNSLRTGSPATRVMQLNARCRPSSGFAIRASVSSRKVLSSASKSRPENVRFAPQHVDKTVDLGPRELAVGSGHQGKRPGEGAKQNVGDILVETKPSRDGVRHSLIWNHRCLLSPREISVTSSRLRGISAFPSKLLSGGDVQGPVGFCVTDEEPGALFALVQLEGI